MSKITNNETVEYLAALQYLRDVAQREGVQPTVKTSECLTPFAIMKLAQSNGRNSHVEQCAYCQKALRAFQQAISEEAEADDMPAVIVNDPLAVEIDKKSDKPEIPEYPKGSTSIVYEAVKKPETWPEVRRKLRPLLAAYLYRCDPTRHGRNYTAFFADADRLLDFIEPKISVMLDGSSFSSHIPNWTREYFRWEDAYKLSPSAEELVVPAALLLAIPEDRADPRHVLAVAALERGIVRKNDWWLLSVDEVPANRSTMQFRTDVLKAADELTTIARDEFGVAA